MTANSDDIYIKADRNIEVANKSVTLGDVLKIECVNPAMLARIRSTHLLTFHHPYNKRERRVVMSVLKVIQKIHEIYPEASVENIGETDFIVTYEEQDGKGGVIHVAKIVMVVQISIFVEAFSTIAFNNDVHTSCWISRMSSSGKTGNERTKRVMSCPIRGKSE